MSLQIESQHIFQNSEKNLHFKATEANDQNILPHVGHTNTLKKCKIKSQISMIY